jgi:hypothetical protein
MELTEEKENDFLPFCFVLALMRPIPYLERGRFGFERNSSLAVKGRRLCS